MESERPTVAHGAAQNTAQDVVAVVIPGRDSVGHGEAERPRVVGDDAKSDIDFFLLAMSGRSGLGQRRSVFFAAEFPDLVEERTEDVRFVIRNTGVREFAKALGSLHNGADALETHAGIDVTGGQRSEGSVGVGVELDEDEVPDLDTFGGAFVDQRAARVGLGGEIDVNFAARTARARVAHHPEIVLLVAVDDMDLRIEPGGLKMHRPVVPRFLVKLTRVTSARRIDRGIHARRRKLPALDEKFPRPIDRFLFEIVPEAPVTEHLKKRVVVGIQPNVLEVVVFAAGANAFLRVRRAGVGSCDRPRPAGDIGLGIAEKDGDELVHPRIGKQQIRRVRHQAGRRHGRVAFLPEEIEEALADFVAGRNF